MVYVRPILIASSYHERASSRHRPGLLNSSVFRWRQKQDDDDKSRTAVGSEFQAVRLALRRCCGLEPSSAALQCLHHTVD